MKTFITSFFLLISVSFCTAQSSIGVTAGYSFNQTTSDNPNIGMYNLNTLVIGIPVGFKWSDRWETLASVNLIRQRVALGSFDSPPTASEFFNEQLNFLRFTAEQHFYPIESLSIGVGAFYSHKLSEQVLFDGEWNTVDNHLYNKGVYGINSSLSYKIDPVSLDFRYFVSLSPIIDTDIFRGNPGPFSGEITGNNRSLELTATYHFPLK
jgi:hypothetical protein